MFSFNLHYNYTTPSDLRRGNDFFLFSKLAEMSLQYYYYNYTTIYTEYANIFTFKAVRC